MIKSNLPVILLKGLVLLPNQEARIELNNDISKKVIDIAKEYHADQVLVVTPLNNLEENPDINDLPYIGVMGKIKSKIDLPNGNIRVVISGIKRVKVYSYVNYSNDDDVLESIVASITLPEFDEVEETAILRKLISELDKYISVNPYISNSIISQITGVTSLDKLTDMIAVFMPLSFEKKLGLVLNSNPVSRAKTLISEINIERAVIDLENKIELSLKKDLDLQQKEFILKEKIRVINEELGSKDSKSLDIENITSKMNEIDLPENIKKKLDEEVKKYSLTPEVSPEIAVIRNYIDCLLSLPWDKRSNDESDFNKIESKLNESHFGLEEVKIRILEYVAVKKSSNNVLSPILCLVGPPGVGKTTFVEQIAVALKRKFAKISLGGMSDTAELIGHRRTYIGSNPGKIITTLKKVNTKNPVILLDEVDKLNKDFRGDPASTLLDILDTTQNKKFIDNYVDEEVDLSEVLFILTANDLTTIPRVLQDRLEIITLSGYTDLEKVNIATSHLIKKAISNNGLNNNAVSFTEESLLYIINAYTKESGVRDLDRCINKIIRKLITEHLKQNKRLNKIIVNPPLVTKYLGIEKYSQTKITNKKISGYLAGLAYTPLGGVVLEVEVTSYKGEGKIKTTGLLGEVINESVQVAYSYIKSNKEFFGIKQEELEKKDFHIHFREGAVAKDGPSAGTLITTALLSYLKNKPIKTTISMTGEITLTGDILEIGGLKEKSLAALKHGIKEIYIPFENKKEIEDLPKEIKESINFKPVKNYKDIYKNLFTIQNKS